MTHSARILATWLAGISSLVACAPDLRAADQLIDLGVARVDITPMYAVR